MSRFIFNLRDIKWISTSVGSSLLYIKPISLTYFRLVLLMETAETIGVCIYIHIHIHECMYILIICIVFGWGGHKHTHVP